MTLEQAIEFCLHMKEEQCKSAHNTIRGDYPEYEAAPHFRLASEYEQIAEWLMELKDLREENINLKNDNERLRDCVDSCVHNGELDYAELAEAKQLLKSAIDEWHIVCKWGNCGEYCGWFKNGKCTQEWSGKDEALKLLEKNNNIGGAEE